MRQFVLQIFFLGILAFSAILAKQPVVAKRTKLCTNPECTDVLFKSKSTREMPSNHPEFISVIPDMVLNVVGVKFSDRFDIMEALTEDGKRGSFYKTAVDLGAYVEFLREAVENKKTMYLISRDPNDIGEKRIIGKLQAERDLVRDLNVEARNYALQQGLPPPEELSIPTLEPSGHGHSHDGHGHSHGGHGHSHGGHGHAHDDGHGHAHQEAEQQIAKPAEADVSTNPTPAVEGAIPTPATLPPVKVAEPIPEAINTAPVAAAAAVPLKSEETITHGAPNPATNAQHVVAEETSNINEPPKQKMTLEDIQAEVERLENEDKKKLDEAKAAAEQLNAATPSPVSITDPEMDRLAKEEQLKLAEPKAPAEQITNTASPTPVPTLNTADIIRSALPPKIDVPVPVQAAAEEVTTKTPSPVVEELTTPPTEDKLSLPEPIVPSTTEAPVVLETHTNHHHHVNAHVRPPTSEEVTTTPVPIVEEPSPFVPEDPKPTIAEEGFCHSDDCENLRIHAPSAVEDSQSTPVYISTTVPTPVSTEDPFKAAPFDDNFPPTDASDFMEQLPYTGRAPAKPSMISSVLTSIANFARSVFPLGDLSDAGVGLFLNVSFVISMLVVYLIGKLLSDGDDSHRDSRLAFDLTTKCKQLQEELNQKNVELQRLNAGRGQADAQENNNLRNELSTARHELQQYATRLEQANSDLQREQKDREAYESTQTIVREKMNEAEMRAKDAERKLEEYQLNIDTIKKELDSTKSALNRFEADLKNERKKTEKHEALEIELKETNNKLQEDVTEKDRTIVDLEDKIGKLTGELDQLSKMMIESQIPLMSQISDVKPQEESNGGSSGWSDFGDDVTEEATPDDKKKTVVAADAVDIRELAKARVHISQLETDFAKAKDQLAREVEDNKRLTASIEIIKAELSKKTKECEETNIALRKAFEKSEQRTTENEKSLNSLHEEIKALNRDTKKLMDEIASLKDQLSAAKEERRNKEDRIKEVESELKHERARAEKLDASNYHNVRELKKLQEQAKLQALQQPNVNSYDPLNISSSSAERTGAPSRGPPQMPEIQSIWEDTSVPSFGRRTMSPLSPDEDIFSGPGITPVVKSKSRTSRKSDRVHREPSPSDAEKRKERKDNVARRRSRSHGRQQYMGEMGAMPPYMPGGPGYPMYDNFPYDQMMMGQSLEQARRLSRSGHQLNYYSSGGSNGGRSPPPEMPLISAVPPPGAQRPRSKKMGEMPSNFKM